MKAIELKTRKAFMKASENVSNIILTDRENEMERLLRLKERSESLGFKKTKFNKDYEKLFWFNGRASYRSTSREDKLDLFHAQKYFKYKYPLWKMINKEDVKKLCKKYNLVYAFAKYYWGGIPEKNLIEMEGVKIDPKDAGWVVNEFGITIVAAEDKFKDEHGNKINFINFEMVKTVYNTCPIVLFPVNYRGGEYYLIGSTWGDEASDEKVVNPKYN